MLTSAAAALSTAADCAAAGGRWGPSKRHGARGRSVRRLPCCANRVCVLWGCVRVTAAKAAEQTFWRLSEWSPSGRSCTILRRLRRVALRATVLPYSRPRRTANTDQCCAGVCFRHSARLPASAHRARARSRCHAWAGRGAPCRPTRVYLPHPRPPTARRGLIMRVASVFGLITLFEPLARTLFGAELATRVHK